MRFSSRLVRMPALFAVLVSACASAPEAVRAPTMRPPDPLELFRRSRFTELADGDPSRVFVMASAVAMPGTSAVDQLAELDVREAYERGDGREALAATEALPKDNRQRRVLRQLLSHVDLTRPLRASVTAKGAIELPLHAVALDRGYPIVDVEIDGRRLHLLWDTGASENILSPDAADLLQLPLTRDQVTIRRSDDALVARFGATGTEAVTIGAWRIENVPWLVAELDTIENLKRDLHDIDGFLSPQLLVSKGCFSIDRNRALLTVGFDADTCRSLLADTRLRAQLYAWNGEVFTVARVANSPDLAVQLETGSAVSFLRSQASRWLPIGAIMADAAARDGEIAHSLRQTVTLQIAGRAKSVSAIDLEPNRDARTHDDIATLGNDLLLQGRGIVVSFAQSMVGTLDRDMTAVRVAAAAP